MLLYTMLYIVLAYLMLFAALTNSVCLNNASFFFFFSNIFLCQGYELSGEIALKNNHYYYYYYYFSAKLIYINWRSVCLSVSNNRSPLPGDQHWQMRYQKKAHNPVRLRSYFQGRIVNRCFHRCQNRSRTLRLMQIEIAHPQHSLQLIHHASSQ